MRKRLPLVLFLLFAPVAFAQERPPVAYIRVEPAPVREHQPFEIVLGGFFPSFPPPPPVVRFEPGRVVLTLPPLTGGPLIDPPWGERVRIEGLPAGQYEIVVNGLGQTLSRYPFTVHEAPFSVTPAAGTAGTEVLIEGVTVPCRLDPCPLPVVRFGSGLSGAGIASPRVRLTPRGQIVAEVPAGLFSSRNDVTVETGERTVVLPYGFRVGSADEAHDLLILPLVYEGRGAHGSDWRSEITIRNDAPIAMELGQLRFDAPAARLAPGERLRVPPGGERGLLLTIPRGVDKWLTFSSHIVDRSRTLTNRGTEIPVVRADDMAPVIRLLDVPLSPLFRAYLRIYSLDEGIGFEYVQVVATRADGSKVSEYVPVTFNYNCGVAGCVNPMPAFGALDLSSIPALANAGVVDLTLFGPTNDRRLWAFVSVTNNETQRVTLWTPQHDNQTAGVAR